MPTRSSVGEWNTSSALRKVARQSSSFFSATSSRNSRLMRERPPGQRHFDLALLA